MANISVQEFINTGIEEGIQLACEMSLQRLNAALEYAAENDEATDEEYEEYEDYEYALAYEANANLAEALSLMEE